ncbi:MAG: DNA-binding response regulator [Nitrospirae bacterium]|nr:MAG: DNA-binding response regulator [Nitrospirota bacterium]
MSKTVTIMIVEDHLMTQDMLKTVFESQREYKVIAAVDNAETALKIMDSACPDLVILDIGLPGICGDEAVGIMKQKCPSAEIIIFTCSDEDEKVFKCIKAGAAGYILKNTGTKEIIQAVKELRQGGAPMSPSIARKVLEEFQTLANMKDKNKALDLLSPREEEVLRMLYMGATYKEISYNLSISIHTVHTYIKRIYQKLHANSRSEAIYQALKKGLIK